MSSRHYISGLDGLRALAVLAVIVYHLAPHLLPGGYLGVDIFFVISGFLITTLLITEHARTGKISLRKFWLRRAQRLLPALFVTILAVSSIVFFIRGDILVGIGQQILGAATFSSNWIEVISGTNYFSNNATHLFMNFWSLAVEEQFYLLWPFVVLLVVGLIKKPRIGVVITGILAVASTGWMAYLFIHDASATRVYYGTDTHIFGLMIGASLAFFARAQTTHQPLRRFSQPFSGLRKRPLVTQFIGCAALAGLCALFLILPDQSSLTYTGGLFIASILTAIVLVAIVSTPGFLQKIFSLKLLKWIGERSYGIYLWHWPLLVLLRYLLPSTLPWWIIPLSLTTLTLTIAGLSYRYLEMPVRQRGFRKIFQQAIKRRYVQINGVVTRTHARPHSVALTISLAIILTGAAVLNAPAKTSAQLRIEQGQQAIQKQKAAQKSASKKASTMTTKAHVPITGADISAVGDSVMLGSTPYLQQTFPNIAIDAVVSRSIRMNGLETLENMKAAGTLRKNVVIALGTNGYYGTGMLDQMISELKDYNIVLVTAHGDREWINSNNDSAHAAAARYKNVSVAEWDQAISPHPELLAEDGIHPTTAEGDKIYADCIAAALKKFE
jgi:peptidoglycan/LPS O-acetylase OafA/YrhL